MVAKLLVAVGETIKRADEDQVSPEILEKLSKHYHLVKKGIGAHKSPDKYGSFPFDPYSHTPIMSGVQQPGMTGQVKEDIISRFFELGIVVSDGRLTIHPLVLANEEFIISDAESAPYLKFTCCSLPVVYLKDHKAGIELAFKNQPGKFIDGYQLDYSDSREIFNRTGEIVQMIVHFG